MSSFFYEPDFRILLFYRSSPKYTKFILMKKNIATLLLLPLIFITVHLQAQNNQSSQDKIALNHIAVHVHNLQKSADFYENLVGLTRIPEPFKDGLHEWFKIGSGSQLHLIQGAPSELHHNKNSHLCFSVKNLDEYIANLEKNNVEYTNWPGTEKAPTVRVDGVKQIYFQDPDGYWIEVNNDTF